LEIDAYFSPSNDRGAWNPSSSLLDNEDDSNRTGSEDFDYDSLEPGTSEWIVNGDRNESIDWNRTCSGRIEPQYKDVAAVEQEMSDFVRFLMSKPREQCRSSSSCAYNRIDQLLRKCLRTYPEFEREANSTDELLVKETDPIPMIPKLPDKPLMISVDFELLDISTFSDNEMVNHIYKDDSRTIRV
jgi:hypothetical protein